MLSLSNKAYNMLKFLGYLHINIILGSSLSESHSVTSVCVGYVEYILFKTVCMLSLSNKAYNVLKSLSYHHINII